LKKKLRIVSLIMFVIVVIFIACALSAPNLGQTVYIGSFKFGSKQWRACYGIYTIVMVILFVVSFFVKKD